MENSEKTYLNLPMDNDKKLFYYKDDIQKLKMELENLVKSLDYTHNRKFVTKVLFPYEVKFNNSIEEYKDDITVINEIITKKGIIKSEQEKVILNLYNGYKHILRNNIVINKENLKNLYSILSKDLLKNEDLKRMGKYYRQDKVFISSGYLDKPYHECPNCVDIPRYMDHLFNYINTNNNFDTLTDYYIKSQIIHLYMVYIHPFFDVNGRTSRTVSMWYLLNNNAYPFIIFNRGITPNRRYYCNMIDYTEKYNNCTYFINFMLSTVIKELEKDYFFNIINQSTNNKLTASDIQALQYILLTNDLLSVNSFSETYNKFNPKKNKKNILEEMIEPLIDKEVIKVIRETKSHIYGTKSNFIFNFNYDKLDIDKEKVKHLKLKNIK